MNRRILITKIPVSQGGEINHFSLLLPRDCARLYGVDVSAGTVTGRGYLEGGKAGIIELQTEGKTSYFYIADVELVSTGTARHYTGTAESAGGRDDSWMFKPGALPRARLHDSISVHGSRWIYGKFTDVIGARLGTNVPYTVNLNLFYEQTE